MDITSKRCRKTKHVKQYTNSDDELEELQNELDRTLCTVMPIKRKYLNDAENKAIGSRETPHTYKKINTVQSTETTDTTSRNSTEASRQSPVTASNDVQPLAISVEVHVENVPETEEDKNESESNLRYEEILKMSNEIVNSSTYICDKLLHIQVLNMFSPKLKIFDKPFQDKLIDKALLRWRSWRVFMEDKKEPPLFYKCYVCQMSWWHLYPFREHLRIHTFKQLCVDIELVNYGECNVIAYVDQTPHKYIETEGKCWRCEESSLHHLNEKRCSGCKRVLPTCKMLKEHEWHCNDFKRKNVDLFKNAKKILKCHLCRRYYFNEGPLFEHMILQHSVRSDVPVLEFQMQCEKCCQLIDDKDKHECQLEEFSESCKYCNKKFSSRQTYLLHMYINKDPTTCPCCPSSIHRACKLLQHCIRHTSKKYFMALRCLVCPNFTVVHLDRAKDHVYIPKVFAERLLNPDTCTNQDKSICHNDRNGQEGPVQQQPLTTSVVSERITDTVTDNKIDETTDTIEEFNLVQEEPYLDEDEDVVCIEPAPEIIVIPSDDTDNADLTSGEHNKIEATITKIKTEPKDVETNVESSEKGMEINDNVIEQLPAPSTDAILEKVLKPGALSNTKVINLRKVAKPAGINKITLLKLPANIPPLFWKKNTNNVVIYKTRTTDLHAQKESNNVPEMKREEDFEPPPFVIEKEKTGSVPVVEIRDEFVEVPLTEADGEGDLSSNSFSNVQIKSESDVPLVSVENNEKSCNKQPSESNEVLEPVDSTKNSEITQCNDIYNANETDESLTEKFRDTLRNLKKSLDLTAEEHNSNNSEDVDMIDNSTEFSERDDSAQSPLEISVSCVDKENIKEEVLSEPESDLKLSDIKKIYHVDVNISAEEDNVNIKQEINEIDMTGHQENIWELYSPQHSTQSCQESETHDSDDILDDLIMIDANKEIFFEDNEESKETSKNFKRQSRTKKHTTIVVDGKIYQCKKCQFRGYHREFRIHKANECRHKSRSRDPVSYISQHSRALFKYFPCSKCGSKYNYLEDYLNHFTTRHGYPPESCPQCETVCALNTKDKHVISHIRSMYLPYRAIATTASKPTKAIHRCKKCDEVVAKSDFFKHWDFHLELKDWSSELVMDESIQDPIVSRVIEVFNYVDEGTEKGRRLYRACVVCERRFGRRNDCKRHLIEHLLDCACRESHARLRCQMCAHTFDKPADFRAHMRVHASLPVYKCERCDKTFSDSSNFSKHKKVHNLEILVCDICAKKFNNKDYLIKHLQWHETTTPTQCPECGRVLYGGSALRRHQRMHRGVHNSRFLCPRCRRSFPSTRDKWEHMWLVHKDRTTIADCTLCPEKFRKFRDLRLHIKACHAEYKCVWKTTPRRKTSVTSTREQSPKNTTQESKAPKKTIALMDKDEVIMVKVEED